MENSSTDQIEYLLCFGNLKSHLIDIEAIFPINCQGKDGQSLKLMMAAWTPGSYLIREYARQVERIEAFDTFTKEKLEIAKVSKNQWEVRTGGSTKVTLQYQVYCREQSVRTNWVESDYAFLTGAATFITIDDNLTRPHRVQITPPDSWPTIACSLRSSLAVMDLSTIESNTIESIEMASCFDRCAKSFHELVDCPILMGDLVLRQFEVNGFPHFFASYGSAGAWDTDQVIKDLEQIIAQEHRFWGEIPYRHYWFLNIAVDAYGGLEHDDCTVLMAKRSAMKQRDTYIEWLGLVSHEFFHTWNVRRLRPKALISYDYHREQYTPELWIAEGITSYYDDLLLVRAGLISEAEYIEQLSKTIRVVEESPGNTVQSLYDSSYDTWIKHYRPDENTPNARVSYYTKGAVVAFLLDHFLRDQTGDRYSLDDVMRRLWKDFLASGYALKDFEKTVESILGKSMDAWFEHHVYQPAPIDYQPALDRLGLALYTTAEASLDRGTHSAISASNQQTSTKQVSSISKEIDLGCEIASRDGRWILIRVFRGGSAWEAELQVDDELIAVGGYRLPVGGWRERINEFRENQSLSITISRRGRIMERKIVCRIKKVASLHSIVCPSQTQLDNRRRWTGTGSLELARFA